MQSSLLLQRKKSPGTDIRGYFHGTVADRVMRTWLNSTDPQPGEMVGMVEDLMIECEREALASGDGVVRWKHLNDRKEMGEFLVELVTRLEPILYELILPYEYEPAKRFKVPVQVPWLDGSPTEIYLVGEMDLLARDENLRWLHWDLKATKDDYYWKKTFGQIVFYDIALEAMMSEDDPVPDQYALRCGLIQPMCKEQTKEFTISQEDRDALWQRIVRMASDIWQKNNEPKPDNKGCERCPVRHACPKFKPINPGQNNKRLSLMGIGMLAKEASVIAEDLGIS